jgi:hypothetical protein
LKVNSLIEFLDAAADTKFVNGPFEERGGIMIVGPPGSFKTTITECALENHADSIVCSDLNVQQWLQMKDDFVSRRYTVLGFPEFEKLYQRHAATASNLEGVIKALISEGFGTGPGGDQRMPRLKARGLVIGGITTDCFERHYNDWQKNGFLRRFLWILVSVKNPDIIVNAIREWKLIDFGRLSYRPANKNIDVKIGKERSALIERLLKTQPGFHGTGYVLMKKIVAVLEWRYAATPNKIDKLLLDIEKSLGKHGDDLEIGD